MAAPAPEGLTGWGKAVSTVQNKASATKMFDRFAATVPDTPVSGTTLAAITLEQAVDERTWTNLADFVTKQRKNAKGEQYANTTMRNYVRDAMILAQKKFAKETSAKVFFMCMSMNNREESQWLRKVLTQIDRAWAEHKAATGETEDEPMPLTFHEHKGIMRAYSKCKQVDAAPKALVCQGARSAAARGGEMPFITLESSQYMQGLNARLGVESKLRASTLVQYCS